MSTSVFCEIVRAVRVRCRSCWLLLLLSAGVIATALRAQTPGTGWRDVEWRIAQHEALQAARRGDVEDAVARLTRAAAEHPAGSADDVVVAQELTAIAFVLAEDGAAELGRSMGLRAHAALARVQTRYQKAEAAWAGVMEGRLWEGVFRDVEKAEEAYRRVLRIAANSVEATEGLARLGLAEAVREEKLKEQLLLQDRRDAAVDN